MVTIVAISMEEIHWTITDIRSEIMVLTVEVSLMIRELKTRIELLRLLLSYIAPKRMLITAAMMSPPLDLLAVTTMAPTQMIRAQQQLKWHSSSCYKWLQSQEPKEQPTR